jgi:hypothetical protein
MRGVETRKTAELKVPRLQGRAKGEERLPGVWEVVADGVDLGTVKRIETPTEEKEKGYGVESSFC